MKVFAPGKLVLTGAYAVLHGAPAIVIATRRGAVADATRVTASPTPEVRAALGDVRAPHVDASSLFLGARKLGLGASAAILVASLAALEHADLEDEAVRGRLFMRARDAHAASQGGGSGVDVAASVYGGVLEYKIGNPAPRALPRGTVLAVFGCSMSARTSELRGYVDRLAETAPSVHFACMQELVTIAEDAAIAIREGERAAFIGAIARAARGLDALGKAAGTGIVPDGFDELEDAAKAEGAAFCVSGAGGGDVAVFVGSARPSSAFCLRARSRGLFEIEVGFSEKGVRALVSHAACHGDAAGKHEPLTS
jgi:phosphomevalonate kinase